MISDLHIKKIDFQLPENLTDDSVILDTVQLPVKNHLFIQPVSCRSGRLPYDYVMTLPYQHRHKSQWICRDIIGTLLDIVVISNSKCSVLSIPIL